jgi:hypothetical protein
MPKRSRKTHSNGMSGGASTLWDLPLIFNVTMIDVPAHPENWSLPNRRLATVHFAGCSHIGMP